MKRKNTFGTITYLNFQSSRSSLDYTLVRTPLRGIHPEKEAWHWQGRRVRLVDGTTMTMPDTAANQMQFPQQGRQKAGLVFLICRLVGITCLSSGALLNAAIDPYKGKGANELTLLRSIEDTLDSGDILLGDAYFPTYFFIDRMLKQRIDILMEQQGSRKQVTGFRKGKHLGPKDHLIQLSKPKIKPEWIDDSTWKEAPESITVRELKAGEKIMLTTLS